MYTIKNREDLRIAEILRNTFESGLRNNGFGKPETARVELKAIKREIRRYARQSKATRAELKSVRKEVSGYM